MLHCHEWISTVPHQLSVLFTPYILKIALVLLFYFSIPPDSVGGSLYVWAIIHIHICEEGCLIFRRCEITLEDHHILYREKAETSLSFLLYAE